MSQAQGAPGAGGTGLGGAAVMRKRTCSRSGFSTIEVAILTVLLVVAVGGLSGSLLSSIQLSRSSEESADADAALRSLAATLSDTTFSEVYDRYNADPSDDPEGPGTAPGATFVVAGLTPQLEDDDGIVGSIIFPDVESGAGTERMLREDLDLPQWGLPRDLNGDDLVDALDHSDDAVMLPITLRIDWRNASGNQHLERSFALFE